MAAAKSSEASRGWWPVRARVSRACPTAAYAAASSSAGEPGSHGERLTSRATARAWFASSSASAGRLSISSAVDRSSRARSTSSGRRRPSASRAPSAASRSAPTQARRSASSAARLMKATALPGSFAIASVHSVFESAQTGPRAHASAPSPRTRAASTGTRIDGRRESAVAARR